MTSSCNKRAFISPANRYGIHPTNRIKDLACSFNSIKILKKKLKNKLKSSKANSVLIKLLVFFHYKMDYHCFEMHLKQCFYSNKIMNKCFRLRLNLFINIYLLVIVNKLLIIVIAARIRSGKLRLTSSL